MSFDSLGLSPALLRAIAELRKWNGRNGYHWVMRWDIESKLQIPERVWLAKHNALMRKGLLRGCACGCRGDVELTLKACELISADRAGAT